MELSSDMGLFSHLTSLTIDSSGLLFILRFLVWFSLEMTLYASPPRLLAKLTSYYLVCSTPSLCGTSIHSLPGNVWTYLLRLATNAEKRTVFINLWAISKIILLGSDLPDPSSSPEGFCFMSSSD